jgi:hypothetical protein
MQVQYDPITQTTNMNTFDYSLFAGMNSTLPVYRGEVQCRMLGMAVEAFSPDGKSLPLGETGELVCFLSSTGYSTLDSVSTLQVCTRAFPCQPVGFWPLPGYGNEEEASKAQKKYQEAYFGVFKGIWRTFALITQLTYLNTPPDHGDYVCITQNGGVVMLGKVIPAFSGAFLSCFRPERRRSQPRWNPIWLKRNLRSPGPEFFVFYYYRLVGGGTEHTGRRR